ncbi:unnamed protein product [Tilletia controversa]|uniref:DUF6604 domain-containing protein n=2 Tax=Tilletia TaxID=13289 RepID=A0A177V5Z7_9BASI|nr:hypothetical protein CF336_g6166 [Tilletia laevis]KAE8256171.1 hypothetical protein A4X03_0g5457 [Tilletia caries]CAD6961777.1 unnamed protein product [Tilletia controversa]KAE8193658.1 hypothetical protein CF335_g5531 [Tilletia laevis]CAD6884412.1 unnamed protein product [Tilletia caries]
MAAPQIRSKYQRYKHDTAQLTTWLCQAAVQAGYPLSEFVRVDAPTMTDKQRKQALKNSKKKAKAKAAKGGAAEPGAQEAPASKEEDGADEPAQAAGSQIFEGSYTLSTQQYVDIAKYLAGQGVQVSRELFGLLRRCVNDRVSVLKRFLGDEATETSTRKHAFFITVLQEVAAILRPAAQADAPADTSVDTATSLFGVLEVEEATDLPDVELPPPPKPKSSGTVVQRASFALADKQDAILHVLTFFDDVNSFREHIKGVWTRYGQREVDLITASYVTNVGIELLREQYNDVMANHWDHLDEPEMAMEGHIRKMFGLADHVLQMRNGKRLRPLPPELIDDRTEQRIWQDFMLTTVLYMENQVNLLHRTDVVYYVPEMQPLHDANASKRDLRFRDRWTQDKLWLDECLWEVYLMGKIRLEDSARGTRPFRLYDFDIISQELATELYQKRSYTLFSTICAQLLLDTNQVLGPDTKRATNDLKAFCKETLATIKDYRASDPANKPKYFTQQSAADNICVKLKFKVEAFGDDVDMLTSVKRPYYKAHHVPNHDRYRSFLWERHPVLCGILLFELSTRMRDLGLGVTNAWGHTWAAHHLYHAVKYLNRPLEWPDQDLLADIHGKEDMFRGRIPSTPEESYDSFLKVTGASLRLVKQQREELHNITALLKDKKTVRITEESVKGSKGLTSRTQIMRIFYERARGRDWDAAGKKATDRPELVKIDLDLIASFLADIEWHKAKGRDRRMITQNSSLAAEDFREGFFKLSSRVDSKTYSTRQLMTTLEWAFQQDIPTLRFNYLAMHTRSYRVLNKVRSQLIPNMKLLRDPAYQVPDEGSINGGLPFVVEDIFQVTAMLQLHPGKVGLSPVLHEYPEKLIWDAGETMQAYLQQTGEGDVETRRRPG